MDVVHGINLDTSHSMADIEQGDTALFSITITNTGNVHDAFVFWDPNSLEGQQEWLLPFGWQVNFPIRVELDPGQSVTKNLEVFVPTSEDPGAFVIYVKGWSEGEPIKSVEKGTYDILELGVFVSIRSTGNIVMVANDRSSQVLPGDCANYLVNVTKNFDSGELVFATPGAPEAKPDGIGMTDWRTDNWVVDVDFANATGSADAGDGLYRRGLYTYWCRTFLHPSLAAFNAPSREECTVERVRSNTPQQALVLLNDPTYVEAARIFAERIIKDGGKTPAARIAYAYQQALHRAPSPDEAKILTGLADKHLKHYQTDAVAADALLKNGAKMANAELNKPELAAWTSIARVVLNLHENITRN